MRSRSPETLFIDHHQHERTAALKFWREPSSQDDHGYLTQLTSKRLNGSLAIEELFKIARLGRPSVTKLYGKHLVKTGLALQSEAYMATWYSFQVQVTKLEDQETLSEDQDNYLSDRIYGLFALAMDTWQTSKYTQFVPTKIKNK